MLKEAPGYYAGTFAGENNGLTLENTVKVDEHALGQSLTLVRPNDSGERASFIEFRGEVFMSRCDAKFQKAIRLACVDALEREGFTRFRKEGVDWPLREGFHAWVGLNTGLYPDRVDLEPNVGVHVVPIMKFYTDLDNGKYATKYDRRVATYAIHLGQLEAIGENQRAFSFAPHQSDEFIASECERLAHLYAIAGLDYARSIASYEALLPLLQKRVGMLGGYPQRVASCLYLMGRKAEARAFIENFPKKYREYIEGFAKPFLQLLDQEGVTFAIVGQ